MIKKLIREDIVSVDADSPVNRVALRLMYKINEIIEAMNTGNMQL